MPKNINDQQIKDISELFKTVEEKSITFEEERIKDLAKDSRMPYINLQRLTVEYDALTLIPKHKAQAGQTICFYQGKEALRVAITDLHNIEGEKIIANLKKKFKECIVYLMSEASFEHGISLYPLTVTFKTKRSKSQEEIKISKNLIEKSEAKIKTWPNLGHDIINESTEDITATLIAHAIKNRASDLHLEPKKNDIVLRLRVDGIMRDIVSFSASIYPRTLSRFKLIGGLKLNVTKTPQDGRFTVHYNHTEMDVRISSLPTNYGEAVTLRLLGLERDYLLNIKNLGIREKELKIVKDNLAKPSGMILLTGATGSGKTTALYAFLSYKKTSQIKIMTLEDPIEYRLSGISQIQINEQRGLTFGKGLRGVLRQDPDVIMVGEIRDPETAEITIRAATTGHIVLSTLHAGSTPEIITQLENMGADPQNLADVLNLLINQKLVRLLCLKCREPEKASPEIIEKMKKIVENAFPIPDDLTLYKPKGCPECQNLGYKGRIGIFEIMNISKQIRVLIAQRNTPKQIWSQALSEGMLTLIQDGLSKVIAGKTTLEELKRVT